MSQEAASVAGGWRRLPRRYQVTWVVLGAIVLLEMVSSLVSGLSTTGHGAVGPSSSYDSSTTGTEALAQLLSERGHQVVRQTVPLWSAELPAGATLFVLDPASWTNADSDALLRLLHGGHRVVLGGQPPRSGVLHALLGTQAVPQWQSPSAGRVRPILDIAGDAGVFTVSSPGGGTYRPAWGSGTLPLVGGSHGMLALVATRVPLVLLASASALQNGTIATDDNAAFALDLAGAGAVVFDEYDHGFGRPGSGLAGLPARWRWGLGIALAAVVVSILSAARRFGPPAVRRRSLIPARVEYVDAMATTFSARRADQLAEALSPVVDEARRLLTARAGVDPTAPVQVAAEALEHYPMPEEDARALVRAVTSSPRTAEEAVDLGRVVARLERDAVG
ncbi:MAG TPA: DUF4350 domain-containing protein [Acidimicrobiales bacterium]|nr:DUF4350 domain-containing protein [Acidimicrobiales bacterium]